MDRKTHATIRQAETSLREATARQAPAATLLRLNDTVGPSADSAKLILPGKKSIMQVRASGRDGFLIVSLHPLTDLMQNKESAGTPPGQTYDFSTDHLQGKLKQKTVSGGIVQVVAQGLQFVLTLSYNIVLARLLSPEEFGLVAMVMTVIGFLQVFRDMGLSTATIQRPDITHAQVSNLFWLNIAVSGAISLLVAAGAPVIAWFYHEPRLINITFALSASFILNGLAGQHVALLNRQMRFMAISIIEAGSMAVGLSVGFTMALTGYGYWSLVAATLVQAVVRLIAIWAISRWRPQRPVRGAGTRPMISFGANLTVSGFLYSTSIGTDSLLIGRFYGSDAVGLYTRAAALLARPLQQLIAPIYTVVVPALSRLQNQPERYRKFFLQVFESLAIVGFVFTGLILPLAHPITVTLLGARWEAAAIIFAGLSIAGITAPLSSAVSWLYTSQGRGADMLKLSVIEAVVTIGAVLIGLRYGAAGVAIACSIAGLLVKLPLTFHIAGQTGPVSVRDLWLAFLGQFPVGLVVGTAAWATTLFTTGMVPYKQLLIGVPAGLLAGIATGFLSPPTRRACLRIVETIKEIRQK